jgi:hypothetical protein
MFLYSLSTAHIAWRLYTKTFMEFGYRSMLSRHISYLVDVANSPETPGVPFVIDYCYYAGFGAYGNSENYPGLEVRITGPPVPAQDQFDRCMAALMPQLTTYSNGYCSSTYGQEYCSINDAYQPSLYNNYTGKQLPFYGTSEGFYLAWKILVLPETASLAEYRINAEYVCYMSFSQAIDYYSSHSFFNDPDPELSNLLPNYCFVVSYVYLLLTAGYGFADDAVFTVSPIISNHRVTWTIGAIMHEINSLPWTVLEAPSMWSRVRVVGVELLLALAVLMSFIVWKTRNRKQTDPNDRPGLTSGKINGLGYGCAELPPLLSSDTPRTVTTSNSKTELTPLIPNYVAHYANLKSIEDVSGGLSKLGNSSSHTTKGRDADVTVEWNFVGKLNPHLQTPAEKQHKQV